MSRNQLVAADAALATLFALAYLLSGRPHAPLLLVIAVPLALRRWWPVPVLAVVGLASVAALAFGVLPDPFLATALAAYTVAAGVRGPAGGRRWLPVAVASGVLLFLVSTTGTTRPWPERLTLLLPGVALVGACWAAGTAVAQRRAYAAWRAEDRLARAVTEERLRIARELHDIVTHNLGVIAVKAAVTRHVAGDATAALETIEQVSREALAQMRRALHALRDEGQECDIPALVRGAREAGLVVQERLPGPDEIPAGVALTTYRVVQEGLSNVLKHAGPTRCRLSVRGTAGEVVVEVANDGPAAGTVVPGLGLTGMRERVERHGGDLTAGPVAGGFRVLARIPA
jgi:signal transduction histidine kinase